MNIDQEFKILQPKYYSEFQCDPVKCRESCCERWKIAIDKSTYEKYIRSENKAIRNIVETGLFKNEASTGDDDFAVINLNKEMACPFLNQDNLCEIFIHMGENSLSKTCKTYPRAIVLAGNIMERGLEMSCSVAAELILLNPKGIEFEYVTDVVKFSDMNVILPSFEDVKQIEIVNEIRATVIDLLQTRTIALSERLSVVGCYLNQIAEDIDFLTLGYEEVLSKIKEVKSLIDLREFKIPQNEHLLQNRQQFHHLNTILSMKFKEGDSISFFSKRYIECLMQVLDVFSAVKEKELEKYYNISHEKYLKPYLDQKPYILENFLVNYVFVYSSELFDLNDIWASYLKLCTVYGLGKFNLVGLAANNKGMNDDLMLQLIQSLSKTIIPDKKYLQCVLKYLEEQKLNKYDKLITLIAE